MGFEPNEMDAKTEEIIDFAEIGDHIDQPVRTYSSGMKSKLGFAISTAIKPDILILDEVLSVGDALFRSKAFSRMKKLIEDDNTTVLFVSHNDQNIIQICDNAVLLDNGGLQSNGTAKEVVEVYLENIRMLNGKKAKRVNINDSVLYQNKKSEIFNCNIYNKKSQIVQELVAFDMYFIEFNVKFQEEHHSVAFSFRIKNTIGLNISGVNTQDNPIAYVGPDQSYKIKVSFIPTLNQGLYLINLGVSCQDLNTGKTIVSSQVDDILKFRIINRPNGLSTGIVYQSQKFHIEKNGFKINNM
jgi:ABC-type multidrug transport system ATPase subunit